MSGDTFDFLQGDRETITGTLHDPAATTGHVLTVQPDKSIAAAPGGGSMLLEKTLTAAEIAAGWDGGVFYAAIEWAEYDADTFALLVDEIASTLDGDLSFTGIFAYDPGAATADVTNSGEVMSQGVPAQLNTYSEVRTASVISGGNLSVTSLIAGKAAYIVYQGSSPPTTGTATIRALRLT